MSAIQEQNLISHSSSEITIDEAIKINAERIIQQGDKPYVTVKRQLELLEQHKYFDFGKFLLQNGGINGYWAHYMLTHPWHGKKTGKNNRNEPFTELENFILNRAPFMLATQQRFEIFLQQNQTAVKNGAKLACIPSGMMGELLYLDYRGISNIQLIGVDYDPQTLLDAETLVQKQQLSQFVKLIHGDAWQLNFRDEFDLISSNGLNIYVPESEKVTELYRQFFQSLKPGGKLVTSFATPPPIFTDQCEWDMSQINQEDLLLQKICIMDVVKFRWQQCFRSSAETTQQLQAAGFKDIEIIYDRAKMFPTVLAYK